MPLPHCHRPCVGCQVRAPGFQVLCSTLLRCSRLGCLCFLVHRFARPLIPCSSLRSTFDEATVGAGTVFTLFNGKPWLLEHLKEGKAPAVGRHSAFPSLPSA